MTPRAALAFVALAGAAFATSGPLARAARPAHPIAVAFGRVLLASLVLALIDRRALAAAVGRLRPRTWLAVAGAGALLGLHFALFIGGLDATSLPAAVSLVSLEPMSVVLFAWALHGIVPERLALWGVALATLGALFVGSGAGIGEHRLLGDALVVAAVVLYGLYLAVARALRETMPPRAYAALVYAFAALSLAPVLAALALAGVPLPLPPHAALAITALALVPTLVGHTAVQTAARYTAPSIVALVSPAETVGAIAIGAALQGARPSLAELLGAGAILGGVALTIAAERRRERPAR